MVYHLPEALRIVNGRSIVAEQAERLFHDLRLVKYTDATSMVYLRGSMLY